MKIEYHVIRQVPPFVNPESMGIRRTLDKALRFADSLRKQGHTIRIMKVTKEYINESR